MRLRHKWYHNIVEIFNEIPRTVKIFKLVFRDMFYKFKCDKRDRYFNKFSKGIYIYYRLNNV